MATIPFREQQPRTQLNDTKNIIINQGQSDIDLIREALSYIPDGDNHQRLRIGAALKNCIGDAGRALWDEWRAGRGDDEANDVWKSIRQYRSGGITIKTLFWEARNNGWFPSCSKYKVDIQYWNDQARQKEEEARRTRQLEWHKQKPALLSLWNSAQQITRTDAAGKYLLNRGLSLPGDDTALRYIPRIDYWGNGSVAALPGMIAAVTDPDGELVALHRIYLSDDGQKAPVPSPKKLSKPCGMLQGASVKIGTHAGKLGVAEGIETAMAASLLFGMPVWSCISTAGIKSFSLPDGVEDFYIFGDNDSSGEGQKAAERLADKVCIFDSVNVRVLIPDATGDWNDVLIRNGGAQ